MDPITWVQWATALTMLLGAAWQDLASRRVPNGYWYPFIAVAGLTWILRPILYGNFASSILDLVVTAVLCAVFYYSWRFQFIGGADSKGMMVLAFLLPNQLYAVDPLPPAAGIFVASMVYMLVHAMWLKRKWGKVPFFVPVLFSAVFVGFLGNPIFLVLDTVFGLT